MIYRYMYNKMVETSTVTVKNYHSDNYSAFVLRFEKKKKTAASDCLLKRLTNKQVNKLAKRESQPNQLPNSHIHMNIYVCMYIFIALT